jgi:hypothetical protein
MPSPTPEKSGFVIVSDLILGLIIDPILLLAMFLCLAFFFNKGLKADIESSLVGSLGFSLAVTLVKPRN